ncbi:hypothetical protein GBF38_007390 [Nibea albiflora]|uniref:Uncharacterized protein n=1 Tax=Nibea albiflora TaxID=240163 RepID=A0ACB7EHH0_NIBAL|nr:hypothetical protein GBF38_007390 [Nibea albiflora]
MIGKILSQLLGNAGEDFEAADNTFEELLEFEEGEWVIVDLPESGPLSAPQVDPLENLLIEHPSMPVAVRRHISWCLAAWGIPLPCNIQLLAVQRARTQAERKKLSHRALHRQNLAKTRFSPAEKRYGHFKQPCQRLYNY